MGIKHSFVLSAALLGLVALALPAFGADVPGDKVRPPVVFVTGSSSGSGIPIGPPPALGLRPDILRGIRFAASVAKLDLAITIDPEQADYWLILDLNEVAWARYQTWTLIDAATGIVLEQDRGHLLQNALHDVVAAIGRRWRDRTRQRMGGVSGTTLRDGLRRLDPALLRMLDEALDEPEGLRRLIRELAEVEGPPGRG